MGKLTFKWHRHLNCVCLCSLVVTLGERRQAWQCFDQKSFISVEYFGYLDELLGKFQLYEKGLSHSSAHSKRWFPAKNIPKQAGFRERLWQNRKTYSKTL